MMHNSFANCQKVMTVVGHLFSFIFVNFFIFFLFFKNSFFWFFKNIFFVFKNILLFLKIFFFLNIF